MIAKVDDTCGRHDAGSHVIERRYRVHPTNARIDETMLALQFAVARPAQGADVPQLLWIADDDTAFRAVEIGRAHV